jgi:sarcosine oxidase
MSAPYHVAIVGLGAMGSAAAWQLSIRGRRVCGFDRFHPPHAMGSSTGRSRIIREAYFEAPFYVPIVRRAYELWAELERRSGKRIYRQTGGLMIGQPDGVLVTGAIASAEAHGIPYQRLTAAQIRAKYPFRPSDDLAGVLEPRAGVIAPEEAITAMLSEAAGAGAELRFDEPVLGWDVAADGVAVRTAMGTTRADRLIVAAGAWMVGEIPGLRLPLVVERQRMFWLEPSAQGAFSPDRFPIWIWETPDAAFYGFPDLGDGPKVARHHGGETVSPEQVSRTVGGGESAEVLAFVAERIPDLGNRVVDARVCLYTNTPDEHFILDRHPAHPSVVIASPCSGHGFKFAPAIGEVLADLAMDRPPKYDLSPFRIGRFAP